jgi:hypothetical protein
MAGSPRPVSRGRHGRVILAVGWAALGVAAAQAQPGDEPPLDPLQRAVVDSLATAPRTTPAALLEATVRAADVGANATALDWFRRLAAVLDEAGDRRDTVLADLGESPDAEGLGRVERALGPRDQTVAPVVRAIRAAARQRRRDPERLAEAAVALASPREAERQAATERLVRGHVDSLAVLVPILQSTELEAAGPREAARRIVALLGDDAREPLVSWLGAGDVEHWPGIFEALDASGTTDVDALLVAPALVADLPEAVRTAARAVLERRAARRAEDDRPLRAIPDRDAAERLLADRLDRVLAPEGLPDPDCLTLEPIRDPAKAADAFGGSVTGVVERIVWNARDRRFDRRPMSPREARAIEAAHLARDLTTLQPRDPRSMQLVLLANLENMLVSRGDPIRIQPGDLQREIAGPDSFSAERAADVLDLAVAHGTWEAAAAVAASLAPAQGAVAPTPLPPDVRRALVRALEVPVPALQFAAARTLALAAGPPPFAGASRVLDVLVHASTARGIDRAVVGHPDSAVVDSLATGISRFEYEPVRVSTGREAVLAARASADTTLVMIAARIATPSALETTQFLQQQPVGGLPTVLVVVDPLDDDGRGRFLSRLIPRFSEFHGVALVDRLDSFFVPVVDERTGAIVMPARLPDAVAQASGPGAVDPGTRSAAREARLGRARDALQVLAGMSTRGWDVRPATASGLDALAVTELYGPAIRLLGVLGRPEAQAALAAEAERPDLPDDLRKTAVNAFAASVAGHGVLLDCGHVRSVAARYNQERTSSPDAPGGVLDVLESAGSVHRPVPRHAPLPRSTP